MVREKMSLEEIGKLFGVSKVTVSKALNDKPGVSEDLRSQIKEKALELGYVINPAASSLKTNITYNIGIVIPQRFVGDDNSYYFGIYIKIVNMLKSLGFFSMLEVLKPEQESNLELPDIVVGRKIDGLIILGQLDDEYLRMFEDFLIPVVFFDFYNTSIDVDCVVSDSFYSGCMLTQLLIDRGHKDIGFVGNVYSTSSIQDRFLGYCKAMLMNGLEIDKSLIVSDRDEKGELIHLHLPDRLPSAIVCNNDQVAYEMIKNLKASGIKIPDDLSVVSFDNTKFSERSVPEITSIDNNIDEMVDIVCKIIVKKVKNPDRRYNRILVKTKIIERDSVKNIKGEN